MKLLPSQSGKMGNQPRYGGADSDDGSESAPRTVAMALTESLRERILAGEFAAGSQIRQGAIAEEYTVSRIPVREAFRQLASEGLIQITPHKAAVVPSLSLAEISELFELRALLETDQLRRAIPKIGKEDIELAQSILDEFDLALAQNQDLRRWGEMNWMFHRALYLPARRPRSLAMIENLHHHTDRYSRMQLKFTDWRTTAQQEHRTLLAYCRKRDLGGVEYLQQHILSAGNALVDFLSARREAPGSDQTELPGLVLNEQASSGK